MTCAKHPSRKATGNCRACDQQCCSDCLVFSFGRLRRPYCIPCALVASGATRQPATAANPANPASPAMTAKSPNGSGDLNDRSRSG